MSPYTACYWNMGEDGWSEYKEGLSDENKNRGPLYLSVYARASKRSTQVDSSM
jgi:hypothetical protein